LERVIDNDVKLGGSNKVGRRNRTQMTRAFIASGQAVPEFLLPSFGVYPRRIGQLSAQHHHDAGRALGG
jgi:hypothetical protein